ncbi:amidohydrolase [Anoxynatronum sibiricum]|uniref:Amidohydrolase n=1 Tax=Anoxynatronum sibiricum TaxID=210623 RepID=A0ABU9VVL5_9CLOT
MGCSVKNHQTADYVFHNANVITVTGPDQEAVAVLENKIIFVGSDNEVKQHIGNQTEVINCQRQTVLPGIIDTHNHLWEAGVLLKGIITFGIEDFETLRSKIKEKVQSKKSGEWLHGGSWIETQFRENRFPTRFDIDDVSPDNPVVLERIFGASLVNSCALRLAGITENTPDPEGGKIERDQMTGQPTGLLHGKAVLLIREAMDGLFGSDVFGGNKGTSSITDYEEAIRYGMPFYLKHGITSIVEPGVSSEVCRAYQNLYMNSKLNIRVNLMPNWIGFTLNQDVNKMESWIRETGVYTGFGDEWVRFGGLKMAIDGGLTSKTAWMSEPYLNETEPPDVKLRLDVGQLKKWIKEAHDLGWSIGIHVMGDKAIEAAVDAIDEAWKQNPQKRYHHLIHAYYPSEKSLNQMAHSNIMVSIQPSFVYGEADGYDQLLSKEMQSTFTPAKTYMTKGINTTIGTDMPCAHVNPFWGLYSLVTRKGLQGYQLGADECVCLRDAIQMMTYNGAKLTGEENIKGSIEEGKLADLIVLDRNINHTDTEDLKSIKVALTMVGGKVVYQHQGSASID